MGRIAFAYGQAFIPPPPLSDIVIRQAVWLYLRFTLSYRDVWDMLAERGIDVSYETVRRWALKFGGTRCAQAERSDDLGRTGGGISTKCSSPSTADSCTSGVPWTARRRGPGHPRSTTARPQGGAQADAKTSEEAGGVTPGHHRDRQARILQLWMLHELGCCAASRHKSLEE